MATNLSSKTPAKKPAANAGVVKPTASAPVQAKVAVAAKSTAVKAVRAKPAAAASAVRTKQPAKPTAKLPATSPVKAKAKVNAAIAFPKSVPEAVVVPELKEKSKKEKLIRDSFTMPEIEYAVLGNVKKNCLKAGFEVKKSELLRIGVALIRDLDLAALKIAAAALSPLKPGRPRKEK
ncbi:MAG: hypothetical protein ACI8WM_000101 [Burkholderiaceae bacterium]|jgi:hypothetical protein